MPCLTASIAMSARSMSAAAAVVAASAIADPELVPMRTMHPDRVKGRRMTSTSSVVEAYTNR